MISKERIEAAKRVELVALVKSRVRVGGTPFTYLYLRCLAKVNPLSGRAFHLF